MTEEFVIAWIGEGIYIVGCKTNDIHYFYDGMANLIQIKTDVENDQQIVKNIFYDEEIPEEIQKAMGKDRIAALRKKGKVGDMTDEEKIAKIKASARNKATKAAKAGPDAPPSTPRGEKAGPKV